ncbi:NAD(P)-dependent oxidoreductase [Candidatus Nucleicultrix amoebiphila]|jgi:D-3-phosphoglycerate dehydrogenase|uniref:Lactate dehydrogenase n=1 Tax=Candidatus Nucleicultrix amoebiphila FS5 TaxID=1414854 RepID=A0A1W6N5I9_9PROT|nr:NAD(P)-dependent oxidoreductase [Candidatus Nucleicultrix amoebiphila]ARN85048.1 hypothetical protein GQ61_06825 [Candidatus Nucleicultrix amoebiphila FS5]
MKKILISNVGFGEACPSALTLLKENAYVIENKNNIKFTEADFFNHQIHDVDVLIAGTEKITRTLIESATKLKLIGRVGVGIDNIDLDVVQAKKIKISYTPDAPSTAVPEFTIALILNLIKGVSYSDRKMHQKIWHRPMGRTLSKCKIGIIGAGKIGSSVIKLITSLAPTLEVFFYDPQIECIKNAQKISLNDLFQICDIISLHVPLNEFTKNLVDTNLLSKMPQGSYLINTSRGGIVNEASLYDALKSNLAGAAIDVFEQEPYMGKLCELENCILTSHIGSMTRETRGLMETQIAEDVINFIRNKPLMRPFENF